MTSVNQIGPSGLVAANGDPTATQFVNGATLDTNLQTLRTTLDALIAVLGITIRSDNLLVDSAVRLRSLDPEVTALLGSGSAGVVWQPKVAVALASTANLTLSGEQTIDGILTSASRILVKDQTVQSQNGIYVTGAGAWTRAADANTSALIGYAMCYVAAGTANATTVWINTIAAALITLGTTSLPFARLSSNAGANIAPAMIPVVAALTTAAARGALGSTATGDALFTAGTPLVARQTIGVGAGMDPVVTALTTALGRAAMGPWSDALVTTAGAPTARDLQTRFGDVVNVKDYAAKGDGATDDRAAILAAEAVAFAAGMPLYFPPAVYAANTTPGRIGLRVTVLGYGATIKLTAVRDAYSTVSNYTEAGTKQTDIAFYGLTVNANALARGFYIEGGDRCKLIDCKVTNAKEAGIGVYNATDAEVATSNVAGVSYLATGQAGTPADGIYFGGCVRATARANRVTDIRRIGIVSESNSGVRSSGVRIVDNIVFNMHDCDDSTTEFNAGVWVEGTNGATVARNRISAIGGNSGQTSGRVYGMLVSGLGENAAEASIVSENHISVWTGSASPKNIAIYATATAADMAVVISSNYVADCGQAVHVGVGLSHVTIRDLFVDNVKWTGGNDALILVDNNATTLTSLTIDNVRLTNLTDADATNDAAHIVIYNGAAITRVAISHVYGFNLQQRSNTSVVGRLDISDAEIAYGSASAYGLFRAAEVYCTNVKFTRYASRGVLNLINTTVNAMQVKFTNCKWDGAGGTGWTINGANNLDVEWVGCSFYNGVELAPALTATLQNFRFQGCLIDEFSTSGFFNSGGSTTTGMRLFVRGNEFKRSTAVVPFQKNSAQPAKSVFAYNTIAGSIAALHDYTSPTQDVGTVTA